MVVGTFLSGQDHTGAHAAFRGRHGDGKGSPYGGGKERVDSWLYMLPWISHLDVRCVWKGSNSLRRTDSRVI